MAVCEGVGADWGSCCGLSMNSHGVSVLPNREAATLPSFSRDMSLPQLCGVGGAGSQPPSMLRKRY